jgi:hypothetical protein
MKEPMFWSGSFSRDISAVANLIPSARSRAIKRSMYVTQSQAFYVAGGHVISKDFPQVSADIAQWIHF